VSPQRLPDQLSELPERQHIAIGIREPRDLTPTRSAPHNEVILVHPVEAKKPYVYLAEWTNSGSPIVHALNIGTQRFGAERAIEGYLQLWPVD